MLDSLQVSDDLKKLHLVWQDGSASSLEARLLREQARDAASVRARLDNMAVAASLDLQITGLTQIGAGAVNIAFSDGHDRGVYPFDYLKELSAQFDK